MSGIRFSIMTAYGMRDPVDSSREFMTTLQETHTLEDAADLRTEMISALRAFLLLSNAPSIERMMINRALRDSDSEQELSRDSSRCIDTPVKEYSGREDVECTICCDKLKIGDKVSDLPCHHFFHHNCLEEWVHYKPSCPLCKQSIPIAKENLGINK